MDMTIRNGENEVLVTQDTPITLGRPSMSAVVTRAYGNGRGEAERQVGVKFVHERGLEVGIFTMIYRSLGLIRSLQW